MPWSITSHWEGKCGWCADPINPGDAVYKNKELGRWCHTGCPPLPSTMDNSAAEQTVRALFNP